METPGEGRSLQSSARSAKKEATRQLAKGAMQTTAFIPVCFRKNLQGQRLIMMEAGITWVAPTEDIVWSCPRT